MGKQSRRKRAPIPSTNGKQPTPVEAAVEKATQAAEPVIFNLPVHRQPVRMKPDQAIAVVGPSDPNDAVILVRAEDGLWRGVLIPPGSKWELRRAKPGPSLWTPPGSVK